MERNRRIAKAYARKNSLTVNGSEDEYLDGTTLGLNSFENPDRDTKTRHIKQYIGQGLRIKINQNGDILVKRLSKANVFVYKLDQIELSNGDNLRVSNSSSDFYALNSEAGELYGFLGQQQTSSSVGDSVLLNHPFGPQAKSGKQQLAGKSQRQQDNKALSSADSASSAASNGLAVESGRKLPGKSIFRNSPYQQHSVATNSTSGQMIAPSESCSSSISLAFNKPTKIFDMNKFKQLLERESRRPYPDRRLLQNQCISVISFVVDDHKMLNLPSWIMIINIVAIDLLKSELGLADSNEYLFGLTTGRANSTGAGGSGPLTSGCRRFADNPLANELRLNNMDRLANGRLDRDHQLTASREAFANAAALGAYNGDHYNSSSSNGEQQVVGPAKGHKSPQMTKIQQLSARLMSYADKENNTNCLDAPNGDSADQAQQCSSSSGFDSHCSSQNDSSVVSSDSNIASSGGQANLGPEKVRQRQTKGAQVAGAANRPAPKGTRNLLGPAEVMDDDAVVSKTPARGKRPPKLPHRIANQPTKVSEPIPIPAPPTSAGGGPSGKANLILVSPTGLSPPLPKRQNGLAKAPLRPRKSSSQMALMPEDRDIPEFATIKHIDENGHCKVFLAPEELEPRKRQQLPVGIPAHAQLAPPATQRHILRYLLSAARNKLTPDFKHQPPMTAFQRPLPILPGQRVNRLVHEQHRKQQEESLYYCGLQARVPSRRPVIAPAGPHQPVSKSAIDAILENFRQSSQQQAYYNQYVRQQISLSQNRLKSSPKESSTSTRPLMKFFKSSKSSNENKKASLTKNKFISADNIK